MKEKKVSLYAVMTQCHAQSTVWTHMYPNQRRLLDDVDTQNVGKWTCISTNKDVWKVMDVYAFVRKGQSTRRASLLCNR